MTPEVQKLLLEDALRTALSALEGCHYSYEVDDDGEEIEIQIYDENLVKEAIGKIKDIIK